MSRLIRSALCLAVLGLGTTAVRADDLYVSSFLTHEVLRYDASTGAFLGAFVTSGSGGLANPAGATLGPDRNLYVASSGTSQVLRFDGATGAFIDVFVASGSGGLATPREVRFGADGDLYVGSRANDRILKYDGSTGAFLTQFVFDDPATSGIDETGGLLDPQSFAIGRDGNLYVPSRGADSVFRYDSETGLFLDIFVPASSGGLNDPAALTFGPDGHLYVTSTGNEAVLRYDGASGAFLGNFVSPGSGGLIDPEALTFGADGNLYVASATTDEVLSYDGSSGAPTGALVSAGSGGLNGPVSLLFQPATRLDLFEPMPGTPGSSSTLTVRSATPGQSVFFLLGFGQARFPVPGCAPLQMDLLAPIILGSATADGNGVASISSNVPFVAADKTIFFQAVELASCRASEVVRFTFPDTGGTLNVEIDPGGSLKGSSTFNSSSFKITNLSSLPITRIELDLSTSILPDMVYDPFGQAGDTVGKNFTVDFDSGVGLTSSNFQQPHDLGFDVLDLTFNSFDLFDQLFFSIDADPTTIQGSSSPGPNESGSVSGLELIRARVKATFSDGSFKVAETFRRPGSSTGSEIVIEAAQPAPPSVNVLGLSSPSQTNVANQTIRVEGPIGYTVRLVQLEGGLFTHNLPGGGFDVDPFEANSAVAIAEQTAVLGTSGRHDFSVTLTRVDSDSGYNYFCAIVQSPGGVTSRVSQVVILQLVP
ncbi:MAG: hypothetical protein RL885_09840 [Planctomycetota bacterium]